jgi:hypothetical protein
MATAQHHNVEGMPTAAEYELVTAERDRAVRLLASMVAALEEAGGFMDTKYQDDFAEARVLAAERGYRKAIRRTAWCGK